MIIFHTMGRKASTCDCTYENDDAFSGNESRNDGRDNEGTQH